MKHLIMLMLILFACSVTANADPDMDRFEWATAQCELMAALAKGAMTVRQTTNVGAKQLGEHSIELLEEYNNEAAEEAVLGIIGLAYEIPKFDDPITQRRIINEFSSLIFLNCFSTLNEQATDDRN